MIIYEIFNFSRGLLKVATLFAHTYMLAYTIHQLYSVILDIATLCIQEHNIIPQSDSIISHCTCKHCTGLD